jgi:hypothetical protein
VRCGRCGNENAATNRFCGMCGTPLVATAPAAAQPPAAAPTGNVAAPKPVGVPVQPVPVPSAPRQSEATPLPESARFRSTNVETARAPLRSDVRPSEVRPNEVRPSEIRPSEVRPSDVRPREARSSSPPVITGHSFLGLSSPGPAVDRHAENDPLRPSSNLDYLLEDEEEEPRRGWGKLVLIVVALALAVGFGYLHFKQTGFDGLTAGDKKPAAAKPAADAAPGVDSGGSAAPAASDNTVPATAAGGAGTPAATGAAASPAQAAPAPAQSAPAQTTAPPAQTAPAQAGPSQAAPGDPNLPAASTSSPAAAPDNPAPTAQVPPPAPKAAPKPAPARPIDPVTNAERYIYGRGVRQDCDHGLRLLKPPAEQSNAKAMILLGALYSTGTCAPRDLPTAYRWFALALHKEPDNQALQDDLQKLWSQMTPPERQLAIKLSQ